MSSTAPRRPVVAIDGPAGSGKSTTARAVADALGLAHLDSGALYRAVTLLALELPGPPDRWRPEALVARARERGVALARGAGGRWEVRIGGADAGDPIRGDAVTREVSRVAAMAPVRDFVNAQLRAAAPEGGVVLDGRDIGTVVFPDAEVKVYLVASPGERARRRLLERGRSVDAASLAEEVGALERRDALDSSRAVAPLARAPDAVVLDTTGMDFAEQVRAVVRLVRGAASALDRPPGAG
jgi:cytidylate kinase